MLMKKRQTIQPKWQPRGINPLNEKSQKKAM